MAGVALLGSAILGMTTGEHGGHYDDEGNPIHSASPITGSITGNCSGFVSANGVPLAVVGSVTTEYDICTNGSGVVATGSGFVTLNGVPVARVGDSIAPHNGSANITTGSSFVVEG